MSIRTSNPVFVRNVLLLSSAIFLVLGFLIGPGLGACLAMSNGPIALIFPAGLAYPAALGASRLAYSILQNTGGPWYARPGGIVFLVVILCCAAVAFVFVDNTMLQGNQLAGVFPMPARILQFSAMFLLWTVVLNWTIHAGYGRSDQEDDEDQDGDDGEESREPRWRHVSRKDSLR